MIEWNASVLPIVLAMARSHRTDKLEFSRNRSNRRSSHPVVLRPLHWLIAGVLLTVAANAWGQTPPARATLSPPVAEPPAEPPIATPQSSPFPDLTSMGQPSRHEMTQHDSLEEATSGDCVPEVALSEAPPQREVGERASLASRISKEVLKATDVSSNRTLQPVETPPGWLSVESALRTGLDRCDHLLRRGAVHSSRQEALMSLRHLFRAMDLHKRTWEREPACQQALFALKEAEDFERSQLTEPTSVHRLVQSHQTPILRDSSLEAVSPAIAAQYYRSFAKAAFLDAADGHAWAADLFLALGKTYEKEAQQQPERQLTLLQHATVCYQAAHKVGPNRHDVANQLGANLLQLDRVDEAVAALNAAIVSQPSTDAYRNLAEAYRRMGRVEQMNQAQAMASSLASQETHYSPERPEITEISPEEFARISPPPAARESQQAPSKVSSRPLFPPKLR